MHVCIYACVCVCVFYCNMTQTGKHSATIQLHQKSMTCDQRSYIYLTVEVSSQTRIGSQP